MECIANAQLLLDYQLNSILNFDRKNLSAQEKSQKTKEIAPILAQINNRIVFDVIKDVFIEIEGLKLEVLCEPGESFGVAALNGSYHCGESFGLFDLVKEGCPNGVYVNDKYHTGGEILLGELLVDLVHKKHIPVGRELLAALRALAMVV